MTTELTPFRRHQPSMHPRSTPTRPEAAARRETIGTRIVPLKTVYLELSVRDSSEDDLAQAKPERHPEWYIG